MCEEWQEAVAATKPGSLSRNKQSKGWEKGVNIRILDVGKWMDWEMTLLRSHKDLVAKKKTLLKFTASCCCDLPTRPPFYLHVLSAGGMRSPFQPDF